MHSSVQFELLLFATSSSSSVSSFNGIPFSSHNHKGTGGGIRWFQFRFQLQHFQFRLLFFKVDTGNSFSSSINSDDLSSENINPACTQEPSDVSTEEPIQISTKITYSLQTIAVSDQHINPIGGNYFYYVAIMDNNNNGDSGAECYDVWDISVIDSITTMVDTIIPICSSSLLQDDASAVPSFDLNHSPSNVPRSILDHVSINAIMHQCIIRF